MNPEGEREVADRSGLPSVAWIVPFGLAVLLPGLFTQISESRIHAFRGGMYVTETVMVLFFGSATALILYFVFYQRNLGRSLGTAAVLVLVFFTWPFWVDVAGSARRIVDVDIVVDILTVALVTAVLWLAVRYSDRDSTFFFVAVTAGSAGLLLVSAALLVPRFVGAPVGSGPMAGPGPYPNAVILVLDGYAREDALRDNFGAEGELLVSALADRGFAINDDAVTNYSRTYASIASMVAMDYPFGEGLRSEESLDRMRHLLNGDSPLVHGYHDAGYTVTAYENWWWGSQCGRAIDDCTRVSFVERSLWSLGQVSPLASIQRAIVPHPFVPTGLDLLRELGRQTDVDRSAPQLVIAHVTVPHPPTVLDAECSLSVGSAELNETAVWESIAESDDGDARHPFLEQTECIDRVTIAEIDQLLTIDPDLAVLVLSDHGTRSLQPGPRDPDEWSDDALEERMGILMAMRVPADCGLVAPARTPVNAVRSFVSCTTGATLDPLPERFYFTPAEEWTDVPFVELTDRMRSIQG